MYERSNNIQKSIDILLTCLDFNPTSKYLHFQIAIKKMKLSNTPSSDIGYHLMRSFTPKDKNFSAQFLYARHLYLEGEIDQASEIFEYLGSVNIDSTAKQKPQEISKKNDQIIRYEGVISRLEANYCFIIRDTFQDTVFSHKKFNKKIWHELRTSKRVSFQLAFNYKGPFALDIQ